MIAVIIVAVVFVMWLRKGFIKWILITSAVIAAIVAMFFMAVGYPIFMGIFFFMATVVCWYVILNALYAFNRERKAIRAKKEGNK